jgi:hypothetical protein
VASRQAAGETAGDAPGFAMDILFEGGAIAFALAAVFVVLAIVAPLIGVVVDLVLAILLTALGVAGRLLLRRPWSVEAVSDTGERHRWQVVGWRGVSSWPTWLTLSPTAMCCRPQVRSMMQPTPHADRGRTPGT